MDTCSFSVIVQIHTLELLKLLKNIWFIGVFIKTTNAKTIPARTVLKGVCFYCG